MIIDKYDTIKAFWLKACIDLIETLIPLRNNMEYHEILILKDHFSNNLEPSIQQREELFITVKH